MVMDRATGHAVGEIWRFCRPTAIDAVCDSREFAVAVPVMVEITLRVCMGVIERERQSVRNIIMKNHNKPCYFP